MFHSPADKIFRHRRFLLVLAFVPMLLGGFIGYAMYDGSNGVLAGLIIGGCVGLTLLAWKATTSSRVETHPEGIYWHGAFKENSIPWNDITEVRYWHRLRAQAVGAHFGIIGAIVALRAAKNPNAKKESQNLTLISPQGKIKISSNFESIDELMDVVFSKVNPRIKAAAQKAIADGGTAKFGKIQLSAQGIIWKNKPPIPYERISKAGIEAQFLKIKAEGKWLDLVATYSKKVPNIFVLLEIIEERRSSAVISGAPPVLGSGTKFGF